MLIKNNNKMKLEKKYNIGKQVYNPSAYELMASQLQAKNDSHIYDIRVINIWMDIMYTYKL